MKSLMTGVFWPAWEWTTRPTCRWLFASYAASLSIRDSIKCRRVIESDWYQAFWGESVAIGGDEFYSSDGKPFELTNDQNAKVKFENSKTGFRLATSVTGSATGERANRVVADDPHNVKDRESEAKRTGVLDWHDNVYSNRRNDYQNDALVVIHQRVHEKDLTGHLMARGGYELLCLPTEFEPTRRTFTSIGWTDPRKDAGELLFFARFGPAEVAEAKLTLGPTGYAGQHQQSPSPAGGGRFKQSDFRYYTSVRMKVGSNEATVYQLHQLDGTFRLVNADDCDRFAMMDPAGTDKQQNEKACYTVIGVWDVSPDGEMIKVAHVREQVESPDAADLGVKTCREYDCPWIGVERNGIGLGVVQTIRRRGIAVRGILARGSKEARSETAEIRIAAHQVYWPAEAPWKFELEKELTLFPNAEYLDQVDELSHAAIWVQHNRGAPKSLDGTDRKAEDDEVAEEEQQPMTAIEKEIHRQQHDGANPTSTKESNYWFAGYGDDD